MVMIQNSTSFNLLAAISNAAAVTSALNAHSLLERLDRPLVRQAAAFFSGYIPTLNDIAKWQLTEDHISIFIKTSSRLLHDVEDIHTKSASKLTDAEQSALTMLGFIPTDFFGTGNEPQTVMQERLEELVPPNLALMYQIAAPYETSAARIGSWTWRRVLHAVERFEAAPGQKRTPGFWPKEPFFSSLESSGNPGWLMHGIASINAAFGFRYLESGNHYQMRSAAFFLDAAAFSRQPWQTVFDHFAAEINKNRDTDAILQRMMELTGGFGDKN